MPTRRTTLEIRPSSSVQGISSSLTSPNTIIPAPSSYPSGNSSSCSSSPSSPYKTQRSTSASSYPPSSGYSPGSIESELLSIQITGINGRKSFGELAREIQKTVRPPRERARVRDGMGGRGAEKRKRGNGELFPTLGRGAGRGRTYAGVTKRAAERKVEKKVQKKEEKIEVDVEAGLKRRICSEHGGSTRRSGAKCDGWKLVRREGAGNGSPGVSGTKMVLCNHFVELLKQMYAEEDE
ncbi:hypothetical protein HOY82DRAFT_590494 [Tuber indicum]|nr:hypothetical protein HOY82DRAFT_590494 [Tuber indicum]